jgi:hypothetical protein
MQNTPRQHLLEFAHLLQGDLFSKVTESVGELSEQAKLFIAVLTLVPVQPHLPSKGRWNGRPARDRQALPSAFIAKAVYGFSKTRELMSRLRCDSQLLRLCGWNSPRQLPHESIFSRTFAEFADSELPQPFARSHDR